MNGEATLRAILSLTTGSSRRPAREVRKALREIRRLCLAHLPDAFHHDRTETPHD